MNKPFVQLSITMLCYVLFFLSLRKASKEGSNKLFVQRNCVVDLAIINEFQVAGLFLLGILTILLRSQEHLKFLSIPREPGYYVATGILSVAGFVIAWLAAGKKIKCPDHLNFPLNNNPKAAGAYFVLRLAFIIAYELFLRGALLFDVAFYTGIIVSAIVNVILYVVLHVYDNRQEIIGAIPFGFTLCWITWQTQSIWPAVILHLVLALTAELRICFHHFQSPKKMII
jgi:membrane protease YdiL (CAAX protease family)